MRKDVNAGREKDAAAPVRVPVAIAHGCDRRLNRGGVVGHPSPLAPKAVTSTRGRGPVTLSFPNTLNADGVNAPGLK